MLNESARYNVLGIMSGTSLDGIDLAVCSFTHSNANWDFKIDTATTISYTEAWKQKLQEAVYFSSGRLHTLNKDYTQFLATQVLTFIEKHHIQHLDAICSHGHTILHQPEKGITLQIGNLPELAEYTKQRVVCDFRVQDVALEGQGAPLVPIGDQLLFSKYDYCLNLGGFANCSFEKDNTRIAYDICAVNIVLNRLAEQLGVPYDSEGQFAASGTLDHALLEKLNALDYYSQKAPKSLGLEWVQQYIVPILNASDISVIDQLHTFTESVAKQLAEQFRKGSSVLVTGGGAYNTYLLKRVQSYKQLDLIIPKRKLIEFKEALVFGLLGVLKLRGEVNCFASVTGAKENHSSGKVFLPHTIQKDSNLGIV